MAVAMDLDTPASPEAELCSICLDPVAAAPSPSVRSIALLQCGHKFHLDCIGSAFNAKGTMQCPNCRNIEEGNWLSANTIPPSTDSNFGFGNGVPSETHEVLIDLQPTVDLLTVDRARAIGESIVLLTELAQSSSIDGSTPLDSVLQSVFLDDDELEPISYGSNSEPMPFYHQTTGVEGYPTADLSNIQIFYGTESRITVIDEEPYLGIVPLLDFVSHPTTPFGFEVPRYDGSNQRHSTGSTPQSGSSSVAPLRPSPAVTSGGHGNGLGGHVVQQTVPPATPSSPYPPTGRWNQLRAFSITSSIASSTFSIASSIESSYTGEDREPRNISRARAANVQNNNIPSRENASRRADQRYPYPLGWDTQWRPSAERGTLRSSQYNQGFSRRSTSELPLGFPSENGHPPSSSGNGYPPPGRRHPFL